MSFIAVCFLYTNSLDAQMRDGWSIGFGAGYMNYFGDLTPSLEDELKRHYKIEPNDRDLSYALFLERRLGAGTSLLFNYNRGTFGANDLINGDSTTMHRSLNFKTEVQDLSVSYMFKANNGTLLKTNAIIAPYFYIGIGVTDFTVFGDLLDRQGARYDYSMDSIEQDGDYETELSALNVEKSYKDRIMNIPFGLGLKIRTGQNWSLNLQTDVKYMFTDYLDDVSDNAYRDDYENDFQAYAALPNPNYNADVRGKTDGVANDFYAFTTLSLRYNFGKRIDGPKKGIKRPGMKRSKKGGFVPPIFPPSPKTVSNTNATPAQTEDGSVAEVEAVEPIEAVEGTATVIPSPEMSKAERKAAKKAERKAERERKEAERMAESAEQEVEIEEVVEEVTVEQPANEANTPVQIPMPVIQRQEEPAQAQNGQIPVQQTQQNPGATTQPTPVYNQGNGYDPVVEMYKLETDRLRAQNSDLKNEKQFDALENQIEELKNMLMMQQQMQNPNYQQQQPQYNNQQPVQQQQQGQYNQQQPVQQQQQGQYNQQQPVQQQQEQYNNQQQPQYNNQQPVQEQTPNQGGVSAQQAPNQGAQGYVTPQPAYDQYGNPIPQTGNVNAENNSMEVEEEKKGLKRFFGKKDKKEKNKEGKGGLLSKVINKDDDSVNVESYQFNFVGEDIKVNKQLRSQLKRVAKKVRKGGQLIFEAETIRANESKTNTIVVQLAQILAQDYAVDPSQITYDIKAVEKSAGSTPDAQMVTLKAVY